MEKEFLDVFRNLELNGELKALLQEVVVTKVSINQRKDHIRVYIRAGSGFIKNIFMHWRRPLPPSASEAYR